MDQKVRSKFTGQKKTWQLMSLLFKSGNIFCSDQAACATPFTTPWPKASCAAACNALAERLEHNIRYRHHFWRLNGEFLVPEGERRFAAMPNKLYEYDAQETPVVREKGKTAVRSAE